MKHQSVRHVRRVLVASLAVAVLAACSGRGSTPADPGPSAASSGASKGPIVIGASFPQSGPLAPAGASGAGAKAYFDAVNKKGGVKGHKIEFTVLDDAYDPARLAANNRRLVEQDKATVVMNFGGIAISNRPYVTSQKTAQVVMAANAPLSDVTQFPYTRAFWADINWEGQLQARWIKANKPNAVVGLVGFNNDLTDSQLSGLQTGGVDPAQVIRVPPGTGDLSGQVGQLRSAKVDVVLLSLGAPSAGAILRFMAQTDYRPTVIISSTMAEREGIINPADPANVTGALSFRWHADPADPAAQESAQIKQFKADLEASGGSAVANQAFALHGYGMASAIVSALEAADDPTTSDGFLKGWDDLKDVKNPLLIEGSTLSAGPGGRLVFKYRLGEFNGTTFVDKADIVDVKSEGIAK